MTAALDRPLLRARPADYAIGAGFAVALLVGVLVLPPIAVAATLTVVALLVFFRRSVLSWHGALFGLMGVLLFVPVRKIKLAIPLPFALEPYRFVLVLVTLAILAALLISPRFRWQKVEFRAGFLALFAGLFASIAFNAVGLTEAGLGMTSISALGSYVVICSVFFVTRQLLRSARTVALLLRLMVLGGGIIGAGAIVERFTHVNVFLKLSMIPGLQAMVDDEASIYRSGGIRAFGSAQHPIALAVLLGMLMPLAIYLSRHAGWPKRPNVRSWLYIGCAVLMFMGIICSVSRTSFIMLGLMAVVGVLLRPALLGRLVFFGIPLAAVAAVVSPGAVTSMLYSFTQPDKLISSQYAAAGWRGSGRLADLGPSLAEAGTHPFFGTGIGSRVVVGPQTNAFILDDQFLTSLLEVGVVGVLCIAFLVLQPTFRLLAFARRPRGVVEDEETTRHRDLAAALGTGLAGYVASMFFFDAFNFLQSIMFFFVYMAIGAWLLQRARARAAGTVPEEADAVLA